MANIGLVSPGVKVNEIDLTRGGITDTVDNVGVIAIPSARGPVQKIYEVNTEDDLVNYFGTPREENDEYAYWLTASSFLSYGGRLKVVRCDDSSLRNSNVRSGAGTSVLSSLKIKNDDDFNDNYTSATTWFVAAKNPGTWANNLKVCVIDNAADQILNVGSAVTTMFASGAIRIGYGVTQSFTDKSVPKIGKKQIINGYLQGVITGIGYSTISVKVTNWTDREGNIYPIPNPPGTKNQRSYGSIYKFNVGIGSTNRPASGISIVGAASSAENPAAGLVTFSTVYSAIDWYSEQKLGLKNIDEYWNKYAARPVTSKYSYDRAGGNDLMHILVIDDGGSITGNVGTILEKYLSVSKAKDSKTSLGKPNYYVDVINQSSKYLFAAGTLTGAQSNFQGTLRETVESDRDQSLAFTPIGISSGQWQQNTQGAYFGVVGNKSMTLNGGVGYGATVDLAGIVTAYSLLTSAPDEQINFILGGPGMAGTSYSDIILNSQAKANLLIDIAEERKDCVVVISPPKDCYFNAESNDKITTNIVEFFEDIDSSSYAVFDSGLKYMFDKYNNKYRYVPCNGDVAGIMARTVKDNFVWFSPAGPQRGVLRNVVRLQYSPNQLQRDKLYSNRINPIITNSGQGTILFGDKTALSYPSAFDRINVRRLFLLLEDRIETFARDQLFEFNDEVTRANFRNVVEPYLRDVQAKRGIQDFVVICDDSNNTPEVIDSNEFKADIFIKPARSINYIGLNFVATRTGVSFSEVVGTV